MENLVLHPTDSMPEINFNVDGHLRMNGTAIPENSKKLFNPIFKWLDKYNGKQLTFDINLSYFNTIVSKELYRMFFQVANTKKSSDIKVVWHYEKSDEDNLDIAKIYSEELKSIKFEFLAY